MSSLPAISCLFRQTCNPPPPLPPLVIINHSILSPFRQTAPQFGLRVPSPPSPVSRLHRGEYVWLLYPFKIFLTMESNPQRLCTFHIMHMYNKYLHICNKVSPDWNTVSKKLTDKQTLLIWVLLHKCDLFYFMFL